MAGKGLSFKALLQLESKQFKQGINSVKKQLQGFANFVKGAFAIGSITAFGRQMVQVSKDFEDAMARVKAVSNASSEDFAAMQKEAQRLGETTRYTASEAASALENLTRNGLTAKQATQALSGVLQLAQANAIELANAADIVTNTMNAFGLSVRDVSTINDVLSSTAANAATNINELYEAMIVAGPYSKIMGKSIEETAAAIGTLANNGIKGSTAGKAVAAMYQRLSAITPKAAKAMQQFGLDIDEATLKSSSLVDVLRTLNQSGIGNSVQALTEIFGKNFAGDISQLINNFEDVETMLGRVGQSAGTTARMAEQGVGSVRKELDTLKSMYEGLLISIGQKTSGVVKGAITLLQNLLGNFKTVTGTLLNIASVVVPLLGKRIVTFGRTAITTFNAIKTGALTMQAAMGGIIGIIASLVTWIGTALYGAWQKNTQAMRDARKEMANAQAEGANLKTKTEGLIKQLGPSTDKKTLSGIIQQLTEMFPDFSSAIKNAANEASKTGNWENFRNILREIAGLQARILAQDANKALRNAAAEGLATGLRKTTIGDTKGTLMKYQVPNEEGRFAVNLVDSLKTHYPKNSKAIIEQAFKDIANIIADAGGNIDAAVSKVEDYVNALGIDTQSFGKGGYGGAKKVKGTNGYEYTPPDDFEGQLRNALKSERVTEYLAEIQNASKEIQAVDKILEEWKKENLKDEDVTGNTTTGGSGGGGDEKLTGDTKTVADAIEKYEKGVGELKRGLAEGVITQEEYAKELDNLEDSTWRAIAVIANFRDILASLGKTDVAAGLAEQFSINRLNERRNTIQENVVKKASQQKALSGYGLPTMSRDTTFDYMLSPSEKAEANLKMWQDYAGEIEDIIEGLKRAIENGDLSLIPEEATKQMGILVEAFKAATAQATDMQHAMNFAKLTEDVRNYQKELEDLTMQEIQSAENLIGVFGRLHNSIMTISEAMGETMSEEEKKRMEDFFNVLDASVDIFDTMIGVYQTMQQLEQINTAIKEAEAAATLASAAAKEAEAGAAAKAAIAESASSVAGTPIVGPALAAAAIGAITGALLASLAKFANGGIVGGNSYSGDHNLIRANSGEMVLTSGQQATLFNAIKNGNLGGGGNVDFKIRGSDLVGVLNNYKSRIKG